MKIVMLEPNLCVMAGMTRLTYMLADCFKFLGHNVTLIGRSAKETRAKVALKTTFGVQILNVREGLTRRQYEIEEFGNYHPVKFLTVENIMLEPIPVSHPFMYFPERVKRLLWKADLVVTDAEIYVKLPEILDIQSKLVVYCHFPPESLKPVAGKEPKAIWCNSEFTRQHIKEFWGLEASVVNPPLHCDCYKNNNGFDGREFDVVMFSRLDPSKMEGVLASLKAFKVAVVGSAYGYEKDLPSWVTLFKNATCKEVVDVLSRSKVYVHGKGFGLYGDGKKSEPEHFGITICEAMAAGCVPIVPRAGGPVEIVGHAEEWGFLYSSVEELNLKVNRLLEDKILWYERNAKVERRAEQFDVKVVAKQVEELLKKIGVKGSSRYVV